MRAIILRNPELPMADSPTLDDYAVAVRLDNPDECRLTLPRLADFLLQISVDAEDNDDLESWMQCEGRAEEIDTFLQGVSADAPCSFMLSPTEARLARSLLDGGSTTYFTDEQYPEDENVARDRLALAVKITSCLGQAWAQVSDEIGPPVVTSSEPAMVH